MAIDCCEAGCSAGAAPPPRYRKVLWIALAANAVMFFVEFVGSFHAGSAALLADAADFLGDAANYGLSLAVLAQGARRRSRAALVKGVSMGIFGAFVMGRAAWGTLSGLPPEPTTMGIVALLALATNLGVAVLLYAFRGGDANMRSVWLCSRNDAIGNLLVLAAAWGVLQTGQAWPDLAVAGLMGVLGLSTAASVIRRARQELRVISSAV